jgi:hypothetical protein
MVARYWAAHIKLPSRVNVPGLYTIYLLYLAHSSRFAGLRARIMEPAKPIPRLALGELLKVLRLLLLQNQLFLLQTKPIAKALLDSIEAFSSRVKFLGHEAQVVGLQLVWKPESPRASFVRFGFTKADVGVGCVFFHKRVRCVVNTLLEGFFIQFAQELAHHDGIEDLVNGGFKAAQNDDGEPVDGIFEMELAVCVMLFVAPLKQDRSVARSVASLL